MKRLLKKQIILIGMFLWGISAMNAQSNLAINAVFSAYGKIPGSTMVEMNQSMLKNYPFTYYKSLTINDNKALIDITRKSVLEDQKGAENIKQVLTNGKVTTLFLQLPKEKNRYRLILYNESEKPNHKMTLIYIESEDHPDSYIDIILKKK